MAMNVATAAIAEIAGGAGVPENPGRTRWGSNSYTRIAVKLTAVATVGLSKQIAVGSPLDAAESVTPYEVGRLADPVSI
jgi:hypothetical protein